MSKKSKLYAFTLPSDYRLPAGYCWSGAPAAFLDGSGIGCWVARDDGARVLVRLKARADLADEDTIQEDAEIFTGWFKSALGEVSS